MGNKTSQEENEKKKLKIFESLINMGFNEENAMIAADKYRNNMDKAIDFAVQNQQKYETETKMDYNNIKNEENKQLISLYKGNIFDMKGVKYFGVLNGLSIGFYLNKNKINNIPCNIINILK
eukprot:6202_1